MAGKVNVPITTAVQGLANTQKQLNTLKGSIGGVGSSAALAAASFAAFAVGIKAADFFSSAIAGARDLERNLAGVKSVFEGLAPDMIAFSKNAYSMGLGMTEAAKATTFIGSVLKQSGFSIKETADLTERLVGLATDLSITYGYDVQEALMGMTALFRGEYDPIEKFGVAMKQSEVNAAVLAKGLGPLSLAQERLAQQQVRVELLFARSADAMGAFERQSGTVAVEQLKLAATFSNVRDSVAVGLLPAIGSLLSEMNKILFAMGPELQSKINQFGPKLERLVQNLVPVMENLADGVLDTLDVMADLFDFLEDNGSILLTLAAGALGAAGAFGIMTGAIGAATGAMTAFTAAVVANPYAAVIAGFIGLNLAVFTATSTVNMQAEPAFLELTARTDELGSAVDRMQPSMRMLEGESEKASRYLSFLRGRVLELNKAFVNTTTLTGILAASGMTMDDIKPPEIADAPAGPAARNFVKEYFANLRDEMAKQTARLRLERMGASAGLIDSIVSGDGWKKVFDNVIKAGAAGLAKIQRDFNKTSAGVKELEQARATAAKAAKEAEEAAAKAAEELAEKLAEANEELERRIGLLRDFATDIKKLAGFDVLSTYERQLGRFEQSSVDSFAEIRDSLQEAFDSGLILDKSLRTLQDFVDAEEKALNDIQRNRDELAERYSLADTLIKEYRAAFTAAMSLSSLFSKLKGETEERTVREVSKGVIALSNGLREFNVTVTREYEETINKVTNKTAALVDGFRDIAGKARLFANNLRQLHQLGLNPQLFAQLVEAGVEAGGETAQALVDGGADTISEINSLFKEIDSLGADLGEQVATTLYGKGVDMSKGLLAGIKSLETDFELQAKSMAELFAVAFANAIDAAIETARLKLVNELPMITTPAGGPVGSGAPFPNAIIITPEAPPIDMPRQFVPMPGGAPFPTGGVLNTFNINVNASGYAGGVQAGQGIVEELKSFERNNGSVSTFLVSGLA